MNHANVPDLHLVVLGRLFDRLHEVPHRYPKLALASIMFRV